MENIGNSQTVAASGTAATPDKEGEIDLLPIVRLIWRSKFIIALCVLFTASLGAYYAYEVAKPQFSATAIVEFTPEQRAILGLDSILGGGSTDAAGINTELQIIGSREIMEKLVTRLDLTSNPEFNPALRAPSFSVRRAYQEFMGQPTRTDRMTPEDLEREAFLQTTDAVRRAITIVSTRDTNLFRITVQSDNRNTAALVANTLADIYIEEQITEKFAATEHTIKWLTDRVRQLKDDFQLREEDIARLKSSSELLSRKTLEGLILQSNDFRDRKNARTRDLERAQTETNRLTTLRSNGDRDALLNALGDTLLTRLAAPLDEALNGTAAARAAFENRFNGLIQIRKNTIKRLEDDIAALETSLVELDARVQEQGGGLQMLEQLERERDVTQELYQTFLTGLQEATVQVGLVRADTRVMSTALPPLRPFAPRKSLIIAAAALLGGLFAVVVLLIREATNTSIRSTQELEQTFGIDVIGEIPALPSSKRASFIQYLASKPASATAEAIRNLRTSVMMSNVDKHPRTIMVTSSIPGEGKTSVSIAMALNLSGLNKNILLLEGDLRRRTFEQYFEKTNKDDTGIYDIIAGDKTLAETVSRDPKYKFDVLHAQKIHANPGDLYASEKFKDFMQTALETYDYIVIDTPPVLAVPDARLIAGNVDAVVYVVKWDSTSKMQVLEGVRQFKTMSRGITGFALSQISARKMKRYGYYARYGDYGKSSNKYYDN